MPIPILRYTIKVSDTVDNKLNIYSFEKILATYFDTKVSSITEDSGSFIVNNIESFFPPLYNNETLITVKREKGSYVLSSVTEFHFSFTFLFVLLLSIFGKWIFFALFYEMANYLIIKDLIKSNMEQIKNELS